jgi:MFS family permease
MITIETPHKNLKKWRSRVFTFLTVFLSIALLIAGTFEFIPAWILKDPADSIHLWHISELTAIAILLGGVMFGLVRKSAEKPLLAQFIVMSLIILALGIAPFSIPVVGLLPLAGLLVLTYPKPRALFSFSHQRRMSIALLAITVPLAVILIPIMLQEIHYQIIGMTENDAHAQLLHWIGSALLYVLLILAGVLASTKRPGWKRLGIVTGLTYCFLGVIGLIVPGYAAGAWSEAGGLFALFFGALYILITLAEAEGMSQGVSVPVPESAQKPEAVSETIVKATPAHEAATVFSTLSSYQANERIEITELEFASRDRK